MNRPLTITLCICAAVLTGCGVWVAWHLNAAIDARQITITVTNATLDKEIPATLTKANALLDSANTAVGSAKAVLDSAKPVADNANKLVVKASEAVPSKETVAGITAAAQDVISGAGKAIADTSNNLNRPCKGKSGPDACGTLANVNKVAIKIGDAVVTTQDQEKNKVIPHTLAAVDALKDLVNSEDVKGSLHQGLGILTDVHHATTQYLNPPPCKTKWCKTGRILGHVGSAATLLATGVEIDNRFQPIRVKVQK